MKAVILAGGLGTRLSEETSLRPKPLVEIGGRPILWHIMQTYSSHGITDFIVCCGYKGYMIKEYFANYFLHMCDVTFDMSNNTMITHQARAEPWKVTLVDTGDATMTGGRLLRVRDYIDDTFCFTYGDGVGNVDITATIDFHNRGQRLATLTAASPPGRFGALDLKDGLVHSFHEKPQGDGSYINAGFFVLEPGVMDRISSDDTVWEREPLESLAREQQLGAWLHEGFWQPMDTLRDKIYLESLWESGKAPWRLRI
ncbi:MAG TPA: glucose-1-phosphate cytidylyltransferase [Afipia sp.]